MTNIDNQEALAGDDRNGVELRCLVDQALDALDSIAGDRTPKFFPETSYDCARREARELREKLATLSRTPSSPQADVADVERVAAVIRPLITGGSTFSEDERDEMAADMARAALTKPAALPREKLMLCNGCGPMTIDNTTAGPVCRNCGSAVSALPEEGEEAEEWLLAQLDAWPTRVDPDKTTNIEFLMRAAATCIRALSSLPVSGEVTPIYRAAAKREFKNELGRDILAGVEVGNRPDGYCRIFIYGPDSGVDSYVTHLELAKLYSAMREVFPAASVGELRSRIAALTPQQATKD